MSRKKVYVLRTDTLLRGCRLLRRMRDPDDVIVDVARSHDISYSSLPRDLHGNRSRRTRSDPSTHRSDHSSSSLVRSDSGLVSPVSLAFTDELIVPPAPVNSLNTEQRFVMSTHATSFDSNISHDVADTSRVRREDKENRTSRNVAGGARKTKKKRRVKKNKELNTSRSTEKLAVNGDERRRATAGPWRSVDGESLWEWNGVKLWRFCEKMLGYSSRPHANDTKSAGEVAMATAPQPGTGSGVVVSALALINEVNQRRVRLVLRRVTVSEFNSRCRTFISVCNQPATQGQLSRPSLRGR